MDQSNETSPFDIHAIVEQQPFQSPAVQSFFTRWCEINDSIKPQIVDRRLWEQKDGIILEKDSDGTQTLYIPSDLQLWEMVGAMEVVDHDTFTKKPGRQKEKATELRALGKIFRDSGVYIAQRLDSIDTGVWMAQALAEELYQYGQSLVTGGQAERPIPINILAHQSLSSADTEMVDRFLAGEALYQSRKAKAQQTVAIEPAQSDELYEAQRCHTLAQFFRVAEKALRLRVMDEYRQSTSHKKHRKPWQIDTPIHTAFLKKAAASLTKEIETPQRELTAAIFRRGMHKLMSDMREGEIPIEYGWRDDVNYLFENLVLICESRSAG